jgi:hypothetical protein
MKRFASPALFILAFAGLSAVWFFVSRQQHNPPRSWENFPLYPSGENVSQETSESGVRTFKTIKFQTEDNSDVVLQYYVDALVKDGWHFRGDLIKVAPSERIFGWSSAVNHPTYTVSVSAIDDGTGLTIVTIEMVKDVTG